MSDIAEAEHVSRPAPDDAGDDGGMPTPKTPPPPPDPSADKHLAMTHRPDATAEPVDETDDKDETDDLWSLTPLAALRLLSEGVEVLVAINGDVPPTPPPASVTIAHMRGIQTEKTLMARSQSDKKLAREKVEATAVPAVAAEAARSRTPPQIIDGVHLRARQSRPQAPPPSPEPYLIVGDHSQPLNLQHGAITRKFYSKAPPPIGVGDYLARLHRWCPMSTAVYLATSLYLHRLAVVERAVAVTRRNAHRLLLAGLRVAMKALEDACYPHAKMARVGGVSEPELARLEISFCFLAGFELIVGEEAMRDQLRMLKGVGAGLVGPGAMTLTLERKRKDGSTC